MVTNIMLTTYFISISMFLQQTSVLILWVLVELNMVLFLGMNLNYSKMNKESNMISSIFYYFIIQSMGTMFLLVSMSGMFFYCEEIKNITTTLSIMMKLGVFPFQFWMFKIYKKMGLMMMMLLVTTQKIPYILMMDLLNTKILSLVMLTSSMLSIMMIWSSKTLGDLIISSSIYSNIWMWMYIQSSMKAMLIFMILYFISIYPACKQNKEGTSSEMGGITSLLFFMGLPPMMMFYMEFNVIKSLTITSNMATWMFLILITSLGTMSYFKKLYILMKSTKKKKSKKNMEIVTIMAWMALLTTL